MNVLYAGLMLGTAMGNACAQLRVEIAGVGSNQIPVAIATFADEHLRYRLTTLAGNIKEPSWGPF